MISDLASPLLTCTGSGGSSSSGCCRLNTMGESREERRHDGMLEIDRMDRFIGLKITSNRHFKRFL